MEIKVGQLILRTLALSDIEEVREQRNNQWISKYLVSKKYITKENQQEWFDAIDWKSEYYWIFEWNNTDLGMVYINRLDVEQKSAQTNVFIFNQEDIGHPEIIKTVWLITYLCFEKFKLSLLFSKVHLDNLSAIEMDQFLGFEVYDQKEYYFYLKCTKENFELNSTRILLLFFKKSNTVSYQNIENSVFAGQSLEKTESENLYLKYGL